MNGSISAMAQEIDATVSASEHIDFIKVMLQKHSTSEERLRELIEPLTLVERRAADPVLHLAILGEFSSGKSTFINALLKHRLLKSARVATTASATHITFGPKLSVNATFLDGKCVQATALDTRQLSQAIAQIRSQPVKIFPIREAIELLTTDQTVADAVERVDISLPSRSLRAGLSIIDTPGIGAGAAATKMHSQITQTVIEKYADAAIVLVPSAQPMSKTLIAFLQNSPRHFLQRCIFVVTSMDTQLEADRQTILAFVRQCLTKKIGLLEPAVYQCAAMAVLPSIVPIPADQQLIRTAWQQQFSRLEDFLLKEVLRQRHLVISERLASLCRSLLLELEADIETRQSIVRNGVQKLETDCLSVVNELLGDHRERQHRLMLKAQDIERDQNELIRRRQMLETLTQRLAMCSV